MSKLLFGISSPSFNLFLFASFSLFRIKNMGQLRPIFFSSFSHYKSTLNWKKQSVDDVVLGIRTRDRIMIGTDGSPELWQPLFFHILTSDFSVNINQWIFSWKTIYSWAVVVAELVEWSLPTPELRRSNPVTWNWFYRIFSLFLFVKLNWIFWTIYLCLFIAFRGD